MERLLLDADIDPELAPLLTAVGFQVELAPRNDPLIRSDTLVLRLARKQRRIMVCHDKHRDRGTRYELYKEIYDSGGKVIGISGDSSQPCLLALAKILMHRERWLTFFAENTDGKVIVHQTGMTEQPPELLMKKILRLRDIEPERLKEIRPRKGTRRFKEPAAQARLPDI